MGNVIRFSNDAFAFVLELVALGALGIWGAKVGPNLGTKIVLAVGIPLIAAVLWGLFASPRATVTLPLAGVLLVKAGVFGSAAAAMGGVGHRNLGIAFAVIAAVNTAAAVLMARNGAAAG